MIEQSLLLGVIHTLCHTSRSSTHAVGRYPAVLSKRCAYSVVEVRELTVPGEWQVVKGCMPLVGVSLFSSALAVY